eukprot:6198720-Pleurochrysis_carterae.AAC.1
MQNAPRCFKAQTAQQQSLKMNRLLSFHPTVTLSQPKLAPLLQVRPLPQCVALAGSPFLAEAVREAGPSAAFCPAHDLPVRRLVSLSEMQRFRPGRSRESDAFASNPSCNCFATKRDPLPGLVRARLCGNLKCL